MLTLTFILGSSIIFAYIREHSPETYRCPYCSQIEIGTYHRFKCLILSGQEGNILLQSATQLQDYRQSASQGTLTDRYEAPAAAHDEHKNRILAFLPGFLSQQPKNLTPALSHHVHLASRAC